MKRLSQQKRREKVYAGLCAKYGEPAKTKNVPVHVVVAMRSLAQSLGKPDPNWHAQIGG